MTPKIATCCYCGTRAALTLIGTERHELACSNCGAPLHEMKMLKSNASGDRELVRNSPVRADSRAPYKKSKKKKKKSRAKHFLGELFDVAEDIFDVFD